MFFNPLKMVLFEKKKEDKRSETPKSWWNSLLFFVTFWFTCFRRHLFKKKKKLYSVLFEKEIQRHLLKTTEYLWICNKNSRYNIWWIVVARFLVLLSFFFATKKNKLKEEWTISLQGDNHVIWSLATSNKLHTNIIIFNFEFCRFPRNQLRAKHWRLPR